MLRRTFIPAISLCLLLSARIKAQTTQPEKHAITVTGIAEREVAPDEIYIKIVLKERYDGRDKIEVATQERQMKAIFKELGISDTSYTLSDADQEYIKVKAFKKDAITTKTYELKVSSAAIMSAVLERLEEMKISGASVDHIDYTKRRQLKRELYMEAIKAAKEKATYVLEAINETIGKPISITVEDDNTVVYANAVTFGWQRTVANSVKEEEPQTPTEFRKIKFTYRVNAEFAIK
jgi:uncharacterized protein YggE